MALGDGEELLSKSVFGLVGQACRDPLGDQVAQRERAHLSLDAGDQSDRVSDLKISLLVKRVDDRVWVGAGRELQDDADLALVAVIEEVCDALQCPLVRSVGDLLDQATLSALHYPVREFCDDDLPAS